MAQPHQRGHTSYTYNIDKVDAVDHETLTITVSAQHSAEPIAYSMGSDWRDPTIKGRPPIINQIFSGCLDSIEVYGSGRWSSTYTLSNGLRTAGLIADEFVLQGVTDINDPALASDRIRAVVAVLNSGSEKRTANYLLARVIRSSDRHDKTRLAQIILNTTNAAEEHQSFTYEEGQVEALRITARSVLEAGYNSYRAILQGLGFDVSTRTWWNLTAQQIIDAAQARDDTRVAPVGREALPPRGVGWDEDQLVDWFILNPASIPTNRQKLLGTRAARLVDALYMGDQELLAASILHCLFRDRGYNYSVLVGFGANDIIHVGGEIAIVRLAKARNRTKTREGVYYGTWHGSSQGLLLMLKSRTELGRHHRTQQLGPDAPLSDKFYVQTVGDSRRSKLLDSGFMHKTFRGSHFQVALQAACDVLDVAEIPTLNFRGLRNHALYEGLHKDPDWDVHGHTHATRVDYLARCLPEATLHELGTAAQDEIHDKALASFLRTDDGQRLHEAVKDGTAADMVTNVCVTSLQDPNDPEMPCSLGLAACFTCPSGYRTKDHIPGLLAVVDFTQQIRATNPDEWANGEAGLLHAYATATLNKFPERTVNHHRQNEQHPNLVMIIAHLYTEFRRAS